MNSGVSVYQGRGWMWAPDALATFEAAVGHMSWAVVGAYHAKYGPKLKRIVMAMPVLPCVVHCSPTLQFLHLTREKKTLEPCPRFVTSYESLQFLNAAVRCYATIEKERWQMPLFLLGKELQVLEERCRRAVTTTAKDPAEAEMTLRTHTMATIHALERCVVRAAVLPLLAPDHTEERVLAAFSTPDWSAVPGWGALAEQMPDLQAFLPQCTADFFRCKQGMYDEVVPPEERRLYFDPQRLRVPDAFRWDPQEKRWAYAPALLQLYREFLTAPTAVAAAPKEEQK